MPAAIACRPGGCRWSPTGSLGIRLRLSSVMRWPARWNMPGKWASPSSSSGWTSGGRSHCWRARVPPVQPHAVQFQLRQDQGVLPVPGLPAGSGDTPGEPGLQFGHRPGEVHGAVRADVFIRLLPWYSPDACLAARSASRAGGSVPPAMAFRSPSPYPCKETSEARVDVLGCGLGAVETGACSAAPAGEAETRTQSGSRTVIAGRSPRSGLSGDPFGVPG